jgi:hypothetical protein
MRWYKNKNGQGAREVAHEFIAALERCRHKRGRTRPYHSELCDLMTKHLHEAAQAGWMQCRAYLQDDLDRLDELQKAERAAKAVQ